MIQAFLAQRVPYPAAMSITAVLVFLGGSIVAGMGRERRARTFGDGT
jgi:hypothetical protein